MTAIVAAGLVVRAGGAVLLDHVDATCAAGRVTVVVGENGRRQVDAAGRAVRRPRPGRRHGAHGRRRHRGAAAARPGAARRVAVAARRRILRAVSGSAHRPGARAAPGAACVAGRRCARAGARRRRRTRRRPLVAARPRVAVLRRTAPRRCGRARGGARSSSPACTTWASPFSLGRPSSGCVPARSSSTVRWTRPASTLPPCLASSSSLHRRGAAADVRRQAPGGGKSPGAFRSGARRIERCSAGDWKAGSR